MCVLQKDTHARIQTQRNVFLMEMLKEGTQTQCIGMYCSLINIAIFNLRHQMKNIFGDQIFYIHFSVKLQHCKQISVLEIIFIKKKQKVATINSVRYDAGHTECPMD